MKVVLFLFSIYFFVQSFCNAQPFESILGDSSSAWTIAREVPDGVYTDSIYTTLDSSFGGHDYKSINTSSFNHGFIREDTSTGKAWFYSNMDATEYLIFDLGLSVGDSFLLNLAPWLPDSFAIVDSVYYVGAKKYVRLDYMLQVYNGLEKMTFIEGLGSNAGILYQSEIGGDWNLVFNNYLLCSYKDDTVYYGNTLFNGDCSIFLTGLEKIKKDIPWTLYPNPFDHSALLSFSNLKNENCILKLFDSYGRLLRTIRNIRTGQVLLSKQQLPAGLYFFQLLAKGNVLATGKMAIE